MLRQTTLYNKMIFQKFVNCFFHFHSICYFLVIFGIVFLQIRDEIMGKKPSADKKKLKVCINK